MAIEIVDFPIKNGDFPVRYVKLPEGIPSYPIGTSGVMFQVMQVTSFVIPWKKGPLSL